MTMRKRACVSGSWAKSSVSGFVGRATDARGSWSASYAPSLEEGEEEERDRTCRFTFASQPAVASR